MALPPEYSFIWDWPGAVDREPTLGVSPVFQGFEVVGATFILESFGMCGVGSHAHSSCVLIGQSLGTSGPLSTSLYSCSCLKTGLLVCGQESTWP